MKIYTIRFHYPETHFNMPYYFTSYKEAVLYGEYSFRKTYNMTYYEIEEAIKPCSFYKLK